MASPSVMEGWHKLPQELKLEILRFALTPPIELPTPSKVQHNRWKRSPNGVDPWRTEIWEGKPKSLARDLLLVNRQFHHNVQYIIKSTPNVTHLDIMVVKDRGIWSTWYLLKLPTSIYIDEVTVAFRIFEPTDDLQDRFKESSNLLGASPESTRLLIALIFLYLVRMGPGYLPERNLGECIIKKIDMDVLSPTDGAVHTMPWYMEAQNESWELSWGEHPEPIPPRSPETLLLNRLMSIFSRMSRPNSDNYYYIGAFYTNLVEGIGIRLDGVEYQRWDPDRALEDMLPRGTYGDPLALRTYQEAYREQRVKMKQRFGSHCN